VLAGPLHGLRVAFVALEAFPNAKGSGTRIGQMTRALADAGAEVTVVSLPGRTDEAHPRVRLRPVPIAEGNYLARALAFRDAVARELRALRPDVVHFRGPFEGQAAAAYAEDTKARAVFEVNGLPSVELRYHYPRFAEDPSLEGRLRTLEAKLLGAADLVLTQSETTRDFLRHRGLRGEARVIHNGAKLIAPSAGAQDAALYTGSLTPWQGLPELLMALRRARREGGEAIRLKVVGPAKKRWRRQIARAAKRLKVEDGLELVPAVPRDALAALVAQAPFCVAPLRRDLRNDVQGCNPIKLYEYMAAGRAVLATDLRCVREIVTHDETGWLVRPNPKALAEGLLRLAGDPALRERLGEAARRTIEEGGTWAHRRAELVEAYEALLARA